MLASVVIMATRAPKSTQAAARPKGRGRAEPAPRGRQAKKTSRTGRKAKRTTRAGSTRRGRQYADRRNTPPSVAAHPLLILLGWGASAVAGLWMLIAHGAGAAARGIGRSARGLEPAHRRDGIGLTAIGAALVVAATTLWPMHNVAGR